MMSGREPPAGRLGADGPVSVGELIELAAAFDTSSLCADDAVSLLLLLDYLREQLCAAHHDAFRELLGQSGHLIDQEASPACPFLDADLF